MKKLPFLLLFFVIPVYLQIQPVVSDFLIIGLEIYLSENLPDMSFTNPINFFH